MIADASALVWRVLDAPDDPSVRKALIRSTLASPWRAPLLTLYELGNVFHRERRKAIPGPLSVRLSVYQAAKDHVTLVLPSPEAESQTAQICEGSGLSFYDASYLETAQRLDLPLLTADAKMAAHGEAMNLRVYLLPRDLDRLGKDFPEPPPAKP